VLAEVFATSSRPFMQDVQAATMFYLNVHAWKNLPFIQKQYAARMIEQIE